jgi:hypothetical protein
MSLAIRLQSRCLLRGVQPGEPACFSETKLEIPYAGDMPRMLEVKLKEPYAIRMDVWGCG